ncbi:MAG: energy-coupling factor ABC transporter ATP-binding protein [Thermanaerothrix sp.]|uniref:ATP-binding cassette domain-containing protein n=2 Tax=Thermanaerothrix TaxID=1077886 RepID=A0ABU3NP87_9CHLR|nr:ATP-binding cassette domain-containing protein [Thermanaerothrix sp. 4228-RoL]MDT8898658.1 ATP-binding cassette domain-containing protein [Thermanaerothrix sp. 4228-RoL]
MVSAIIEIRDYTWQYLNTEKPALDAISLDIYEGEFVGIIGPNGAGKTTLALSMDGLIPGQYHGVKQGTVKVMGKEVEDYPRGQLQRQVGVVFSDPEAQFTAMTVEDELVFGLENLGLSIPEIRERLEWVTELTALKPLLPKPPYEISGGQKQRVALAAVLAMMPKVMVLDEPTSMLDPISRKRIFEVLGRLKQEQHNTVIVIEHSLENLIPLADRMILLSEGKVALQAPTREFFQEIAFLLEKGIYPPEAMQFFYRLVQRGWYNGDLPITLDEAATKLEAILMPHHSTR